MTPQQTRFLFELLSQPTAPFRESHVAALAASRLRQGRVPHVTDAAGNIIVGVDSISAYKKILAARDGATLPIFAAHMDHPGFHGARWTERGSLKVTWHGGTPVKHLAGAPVWLADDTGYVGEGTLTNITLHKSGRWMVQSEVRIARNAPLRDLKPKTLFGAFQFSRPVWQRGHRLYTKAADDLAGVFAVIETARAAARRKNPTTPFIGLLTRGEEVGFVGAIAHFEAGYLQAAKRPVYFVSLEASRNLPGAVLGKGPIVRLGDRRTVYHPDGLKALTDAATRALKTEFQSRIMDGGACEAAAATIWGLPAIGITLPLGNYHNQDLDGGPESRGPGGPAPEFVDVRDIAGLLKLCRALLDAKLDWATPWAVQQKGLRKNFRRYQKYL